MELKVNDLILTQVGEVGIVTNVWRSSFSNTNKKRATIYMFQYPEDEEPEDTVLMIDEVEFRFYDRVRKWGINNVYNKDSDYNITKVLGSMDFLKAKGMPVRTNNTAVLQPVCIINEDGILFSEDSKLYLGALSWWSKLQVQLKSRLIQFKEWTLAQSINSKNKGKLKINKKAALAGPLQGGRTYSNRMGGQVTVTWRRADNKYIDSDGNLYLPDGSYWNSRRITNRTHKLDLIRV